MTSKRHTPLRFAANLLPLLEERNRARRAALRRGAGRTPGTPGEAAREFYRLVPRDVDRRDERAYWTAATLFVSFPPREGITTLRRATVGGALRQLVVKGGGGDDAERRAERRIVQVLNARRATLDVHLRGIASLLHANGIALDPERLTSDLIWWDAPDRSVQRQWARDFWGAPLSSDDSEEIT